jgi:hypothetical protein
MAKKERAYYYRGWIERGRRYTWKEGYSEVGSDGVGVLYPWLTKHECQRQAKHDGFKAVFYRDCLDIKK